MTTVSIIAITIIAVFCLFIIRKKGKTTSDYLLILTNVSLALALYSENAVFTHNENGVNLFIHFNSSFWFISSFFLYAFSLIKGNGELAIKYWHFAFSIPFLLFSAIDIFFLNAGNEDYFQNLFFEPGMTYHVFFKLHKVYVIVVCFYIINEIRTYEAKLKNDFSFIERLSLDWLNNYTYLVIVAYTTQLVLFVLYNVGLIPEIELVYFIIGAVVVLGLFYLSYNGLQQFAFPELTRQPNSIPNQEKSESPKTEQESEENTEIFEQVQRLFEEKQPYINPELRLGLIADELSLPKHKLSQAINEQFGRPFYDYVAAYRIDYFKDKLLDQDNDNYTILSLALDSGFNSKASMNRVFKEYTGMSPREYKKAHFKNETTN